MPTELWASHGCSCSINTVHPANYYYYPGNNSTYLRTAPNILTQSSCRMPAVRCQCRKNSYCDQQNYLTEESTVRFINKTRQVERLTQHAVTMLKCKSHCVQHVHFMPGMRIWSTLAPVDSKFAIPEGFLITDNCALSEFFFRIP